MKIQVITNLYPLPWEPNRAAFNRQQFTFLARQCEMRITVLVGWLEFWRNHQLLSQQAGSNPQVNYLPYFYLPKFGRFTYPATLALSMMLEKKRVRSFRPNCVLLSWAYPDAVAGVMLADALNVPAVIKVHGSDINMHLSYPLRARQILWAINRAKAVIAVSQALAEKLTAWGIPREKLNVIYNGVDRGIFQPIDSEKARFNLGLARDRRLVLFIGNLKMEKGCLDLLDAFLMIADRMPELDLVYIGAGRESANIVARARKSGLQSRVILAGSMDHEALANWINAADVVTLPSHNEGVPNVLLEAMACGKPVVATRVGGIPEIVQAQAGILVDRGDVHALSEALLMALQYSWDPGDISKSVADFDWTKNANQVHDLLCWSVGERFDEHESYVREE